MVILGLFMFEFIICEPIFGVPISRIYQGPPVFVALPKSFIGLAKGVRRCGCKGRYYTCWVR